MSLLRGVATTATTSLLGGVATTGSASVKVELERATFLGPVQFCRAVLQRLETQRGLGLKPPRCLTPCVGLRFEAPTVLRRCTERALECLDKLSREACAGLVRQQLDQRITHRGSSHHTRGLVREQWPQHRFQMQQSLSARCLRVREPQEIWRVWSEVREAVGACLVSPSQDVRQQGHGRIFDSLQEVQR